MPRRNWRTRTVADPGLCWPALVTVAISSGRTGYFSSVTLAFLLASREVMLPGGPEPAPGTTCAPGKRPSDRHDQACTAASLLNPAIAAIHLDMIKGTLRMKSQEHGHAPWQAAKRGTARRRPAPARQLSPLGVRVGMPGSRQGSRSSGGSGRCPVVVPGRPGPAATAAGRLACSCRLPWRQRPALPQVR